MVIPLTAVLLWLSAFPALLFRWNLKLFRPPRRQLAQPEPGVSILIPARDEAGNIASAVEAALASEWVDLEVVVLDDHSTDETAEIVRQLSEKDGRVRLLQGESLPEGWAGKMFGCWQLARAAEYPWLLFLDADVELAPDAARRLVDHARDSPLAPALVSGVPRQITRTPLEILLIPLIHFVLLAYLSLALMRKRSCDPRFAAATGQLMLVDRERYFEAGGHEAIKTTFHDGVKLSRRFREAGHPTDLVDVTHLASCRMYRNAREVWDGLLKNAAEGLGAPAVIGPMTVLLLGGQVAPWIAVWFAEGWAQRLLLMACLCTLFPRVLAAQRFRQSWLSGLLHPLGVFLLIVIQWTGFIRQRLGLRTTWKGRESV